MPIPIDHRVVNVSLIDQRANEKSISDCRLIDLTTSKVSDHHDGASVDNILPALSKRSSGSRVSEFLPKYNHRNNSKIMISLSSSTDCIADSVCDSWTANRPPSRTGYQDDKHLYCLHNLTLTLQGSLNGYKDVGLAGLQILDRNGKAIHFDHNSFSTNANCLTPLSNLIHGDPNTKKESQMFLAEFPLLSDEVQISLTYSGYVPCSIRLWNYGLDVGKGARKLLITKADGLILGDFSLLPAPLNTDSINYQDLKLIENDNDVKYKASKKREDINDSDFDELFDQIQIDNNLDMLLKKHTGSFLLDGCSKENTPSLAKMPVKATKLRSQTTGNNTTAGLSRKDPGNLKDDINTHIASDHIRLKSAIEENHGPSDNYHAEKGELQSLRDDFKAFLAKESALLYDHNDLDT